MHGAVASGGEQTGTTPPAAVLSGQRLVVPGSWHQRGDAVIAFEDLYLTEFARPVLDVSDLSPSWQRRAARSVERTLSPDAGPRAAAQPSAWAFAGVVLLMVLAVMTGMDNRSAGLLRPATDRFLDSGSQLLVPSFTGQCAVAALTLAAPTHSPTCSASLAARARALEFDPHR